MRILVVEDDDFTRNFIISAVKERYDSFEVIESDNGDDGLMKIVKAEPEMIILDLNLPGKSGLQICQIKRNKPDLYGNPIIIMLTGESETEKIRNGFKMGTDDYITKPFDIEELLLRIKSWMRRIVPLEKVLKYKEYIVDVENKNILKDTQNMDLSVKEFKLFHYLIINKGLVVSREKILEKIWNKQYYKGSKTVDMAVKRLRDKIENIDEYLKSVSGIGYKLEK